MKIKLLHSTFDENGNASPRQHFSCFIINDSISLDAGSLAFAITSQQRENIRNVVLSHAHLDHIAGLPLFIDDLYADLKSPVFVYASRDVVEILERDIFNWAVYPKFSELRNDFGEVLKYEEFEYLKEFSINGLKFCPISVNHKVPTAGFLISDATSKIAFTSDTAEMDEFWKIVNAQENINAILIECAFPTRLEEIAKTSFHLTPNRLKTELKKFKNQNACPIYVINLKPMYYDEICQEINDLGIENLRVFNVGREYSF
jgi:cAMP phosphodiesterase